MSTASGKRQKKSGYLIQLYQIARLMNIPKFHCITSFRIFRFRPDLNLLWIFLLFFPFIYWL